MTTALKTLITKLNAPCRRGAERAATLCMARGHFEVDLEHLFLALLEQDRSDVSVICRRATIPAADLCRHLENELSQLKGGNTRTPVFSERLPVLLEHAWLLASLEGDQPRVRSGHLLLALLTEPSLRQMAARASALFAKVPIEQLKHRFAEMTEGSEETPAASAGDPDPDAGASAMPPAASGTPALDQYTTNLTDRARRGLIDPVVGREAEVRLMIDILLRRRQNNPILTGDAGVGKTAVVEGLAQRLASGDVPPPLLGAELHSLDLGLLQAGASVKGEFENRLKNVIGEVKASERPIILFIDEAHTMIGAGGQAGQNDAANLLKPALARGELRTIAATTWSEYKKYFEKDAALSRRFQVVKVEEPSIPVAAAMLRAMTPLMEHHFGVRVLEEAINDAVRLSARYITARQLPDKAVSVLDTACARVALGHHAAPAAIEDRQRQVAMLQAEIGALEREALASPSAGDRLTGLRQERDRVAAELAALASRLAEERALIAEIREMRAALEAHREADQLIQTAQAGASSETARDPSRSRRSAKVVGLSERSAEQLALAAKVAQLRKLQGEQPLVPLQVDAQTVAEVISGWTGIPLGKMLADDVQAVLSLHDTLAQRVIGQPAALDSIAQRVRTASAGLEDPNKPKGVFLFVGPSGVGKTETALALADALYGGERKLITINMSEYQEAHSVSGLKGSPPGYVGYGEGGVLTEAVRRQPHSVILLDEVEKAHPDVLEMFFQVFDKGVMDDAEGREIDFRNTLIILTSNVGSSQIMQACLNKDEAELPGADELAEALRPVLFKHFKPAFLGRMKVVPYFPIRDDALERIIRLKLDRIGARVRDQHGATFSVDAKVVRSVLARCTEVDSGARNVDHILSGTLLPRIAEHALNVIVSGQPISSVRITTDRRGEFKFVVG